LEAVGEEESHQEGDETCGYSMQCSPNKTCIFSSAAISRPEQR